MMTKCPAATFTKSGQCCGDRTHLHEDNKNGENSSGVLRSLTSPSAARGLDISLFLQPRRWPDWSLLPHSLPQTLSSSESSLSSWQWVIVMSATENNKMQSHCDHRGTLDHWTLALWLLYIRQHRHCSMKHSTTVQFLYVHVFKIYFCMGYPHVLFDVNRPDELKRWNYKENLSVLSLLVLSVIK